jgi:hypothetical protein
MHAAASTIRSILLSALAIGAGLAAAQDIFKCVDQGATAYQSTPCADGQVEMRLMTGALPKSETRIAAPSSPMPPMPRIWNPAQRTSLSLGMSDDEVLNLPDWGRPRRIDRDRTSRGWHEEWTYGQPGTGERHLHFANARLVEVVDTPPVDQVARLTLQ